MMDLTNRILSIGNESLSDEGKSAGQGITPKSEKNRCESLSEPCTHIPEDQVLQRQADKNEQLRQQCYRIMGEYQTHIRRSKSNRSKLLKGIKAGEPLEDLLLLATGIISDMTGDMVYRKTAEREIYRQYIENKTAV